VAFVVYHGARHTGLLQAPSPSPGNNHRSHLPLRRVPSSISVARPSYFYTTLFSGRYPSSTPQSGNLKVNDEILKSLSAIKMEYQNTGPGILQIGKEADSYLGGIARLHLTTSLFMRLCNFRFALQYAHYIPRFSSILIVSQDCSARWRDI